MEVIELVPGSLIGVQVHYPALERTNVTFLYKEVRKALISIHEAFPDLPFEIIEERFYCLTDDISLFIYVDIGD